MNLHKIILITSNFPPIIGGISHHLYEICKHLPKNKVKVIALPSKGFKKFDDQQDFPIVRLSLPTNWYYKRLFKFFAPFYFMKIVMEKETDIILCGQAHHSLMLPAWLNWRLKGVPYGVFGYGLDLSKPQNRWYRKIFNSLLCSAQLLLADSQAAAKIMMEIGADQNRIFVVNPTINSKKLISKVSSKTIRNRYGLGNKKCIVTIGRLVERKGHDIVLKALPQILQQIPDLHYLIVGSGPNEISLKKQVSNMGLEKYVTFTGRVPDDEIGAYYELCDIFVMISREIPEKGDLEGFGIVYLEANYFGKPVVAGRSGGVEDAVIHNKTGLLVDPTKSDEVANAIITLLSNSNFAKTLGNTGKTRVINEFSSEKSARNLFNLLSKELRK